jgi:8-oxo-dGTP pyrophosphatase MutT (NUDIX family)
MSLSGKSVSIPSLYALAKKLFFLLEVRPVLLRQKKTFFAQTYQPFMTKQTFRTGSKEKMKEPNNSDTNTNPVGRFMVAGGAVIIHAQTKKILVVQRARTLDWRANDWEITYGRIAQHEDLESGLRREVMEELGITQLEIQKVLRVWHVYRGSIAAENELIGVTYLCVTRTQEVRLSAEHQAFRWVTIDEALELVTTEGIRADLEVHQKSLSK